MVLPAPQRLDATASPFRQFVRRPRVPTVYLEVTFCPCRHMPRHMFRFRQSAALRVAADATGVRAQASARRV